MKFMEKAKRFFTLNAANHEGFTLVELIVVIAILAILAGVAVPAYSGYIKRAEKAGDLQLLGAVNEAFAAACMVDNKATTQISGAVLDWDGKKIVGLSSVSGADFNTVNENFIMFWGSNKDTEFKYFEEGKLFFANGVFGEMSEAMSTLMDTLTKNYGTSIDALKGSVFNEIGYEVLAGKIDNASALLAGFYGNPNSGFGALLGSEENEAVLFSYLSDDPDKAVEIFDGMLEAKLQEIDAKYGDSMTDIQKSDLAYGQLYANAAILTAAKNPGAINDNFITALSNGTAVDMLKGSTSGGEASADTIAQAAFAYAMYTSYQQFAGQEVSSDVNINDVYATLGTEGFQNYMKNNSTNDKAGYLGAMDLVAGSADNADSDLAKDILLNGFNSSELVALMQGVTK